MNITKSEIAKNLIKSDEITYQINDPELIDIIYQEFINQKATELINVSAVNIIACMYRDGKGVEQDYNKAFKLFQKTAELGYAEIYK